MQMRADIGGDLALHPLRPECPVQNSAPRQDLADLKKEMIAVLTAPAQAIVEQNDLHPRAAFYPLPSPAGTYKGLAGRPAT